MYQTITPTGNVNITDFLNFVTSGYNNGTGLSTPQYQEVTLAIAQSATPYTVTLPATVASTGYPVQYENNFSVVNNTAYGMTYITIKAQPSSGSIGGFPWYVSVRSGGSGSTFGAAGSNLQVQFNDANVMGAVSNFTYDKSINTLTAGNINENQSTGNVWGTVNAANLFTVSGGNVVSDNINGLTKVTTPTLYANAITDGGGTGTGNIAITTANVFASGNIFVNNSLYANIIDAGTYVSTPALYTSDLTPPGGGPLNTTTTLSTINGNLSVTGTVISTGNITGGNLRTAGSISATGNVTAGNIIGTLITPSISVSGNITAGNITTTGISNLGSLNTYNEAQYTLPTSGSITVSKLNGQVQYLAPTGNVTSISLTNFVTSQGGVNQSDTVTLIIKQGATPYTVTMPTNSAIKYAGNVTNIGVTANSVTMASISSVNAGGSALYLITVSPEFV
jgi:hypothetical protein